MTTVLALPLLYEAVVARLDAEAAAEDPPVDPIPQPFGWREPAHRSGSRRIVWVPGDDESGDAGEIAPPRNPGRNARSLGTLEELFTVYLEGADDSAPQNELAQYTVVRELFDDWFRAVYKAAHGTFEIVRTRWVIDRTVRRYGATLRVLATVQAMLPDTEATTVSVGAENTHYLSQSGTTEGETDSIPAP